MYDICAWDKPILLIFSGNVFSSLVYYSHLLPIILSLGIGALVWWSNKKSLLNRILFIITILFSLWAFFDLITWATDTPSYTMFFWSLLILIEPIIYAASLYFLYVFVNKKDTSIGFKLFNILIMLPTIVLLPTTHALVGFDFTNCDREAIEGGLVYYGYIIEVIYVLWIFLYGFSRARKQSNIDAQRVRLVTIGLVLFLLSLAFGNIVGTLNIDWTVGQYGLFGLPIFVGFLAYLIVHYKTLSSKVFTAQLTSFFSIVAVLSLLFITDIDSIRYVVVVTFIILLILGIIVTRSVEREIKQRQQLEKLTGELELANDKLKTLDKLKTEFLSLASHQLRTPLTIIKGYASMLLEGSFGPLQGIQEEGVKPIYASAQGLTNIVEDLLNVSKIEQGGMQYELAPTDVSKIVKDLYKEMTIPAENKKLAFTLEVPPNDTFMATIDGLKMKQVFLNLTDNSIKYTQEGFVKIGLTREGKNIVFYVTDSGVGISPETKAKLFEKFSRGEGGKLNTTGSGLGLYLAREITRAHKGDIEILSEGLGKGSTFRVLFPGSGAAVIDGMKTS